MHSGNGAAWASASARTLARRLRRERRAALGLSRAQAIDIRVKALRAALEGHWALSDAMGAHVPSFGEALAAARLLAPQFNLKDLEDLNAQGNWAKHAPPPAAASPLRAAPPGAFKASVFEEFWVGRGGGAGAYRPGGSWSSHSCSGRVARASTF